MHKHIRGYPPQHLGHVTTVGGRWRLLLTRGADAVDAAEDSLDGGLGFVGGGELQASWKQRKHKLRRGVNDGLWHPPTE